MTISTNLWYNRSATAMQTLSAQADRLNTEISTNKKLQAPSDDALAYSRLRGIAAQNADGTAYSKNLDTASAVLDNADTTLGSMNALLTRASQLAIQANNGTMSAGDRASIAVELSGISESLMALGNQQDSRGLPLFGGQDGGVGVTKAADGTYTFANKPVAAIPIGDGQSVQPSSNASSIFEFNGTNTLKVIDDLVTALNSGADLGDAGSTAIDDLKTAANQVTDTQASIGARGARVELEQQAQTDAATQRETVRSGLEDTDVTEAITQLQKTMTVLQATQASFTKLQSLSLFDYLK